MIGGPSCRLGVVLGRLPYEADRIPIRSVGQPAAKKDGMSIDT